MKTYLPLLTALALLFCFSCGNNDTTTDTGSGSVVSPEPIKVGALIAIAGPASFLGEPERNTALMIEKLVNEAGEINGRPLQLIIEDTEGDDTKAVVSANKLIKQEQVCAIIGPSRSGESMAIKPIADENEIVVMACAAAETITNPLSKWVFTVAQKDAHGVQKLYEHFKTVGISKIAIMSESSGFGQSGREQLIKLAPEYEMTIVTDETYGPKDTEMTAQLTRIRGTDAQAIVNWSVVPGQSIVPKNMKQLGMTIPLFQSHGFANKKYIEAAADAAEGIIFPAGAVLIADSLPDTHPRKSILMKYKQDYESNFNNEVSTFGGHAYDSLYLVIEALKAVGPDRAKIRDFIENTTGFDGIAGTFNFSATDHVGLTKEAFELILVKDGKFTPFQPTSVATN